MVGEVVSAKGDDLNMRVFVIDCPSPLEILVDRSEHKPLEQICKLMGHEVYTFFVRSKAELTETCLYISSIDKVSRNKKEDQPICLHISAHGDKDGLQFGNDDVSWVSILESIEPILKMKYSKDLILVISACGTDKQKITNEITKLHKSDSKIKPPAYVVVFNEEETSWKDSVLAWTILYHQIDEIDMGNKSEVQKLINRIQEAEFGNLAYRRWDTKEKKYLKYPNNKK